MYRAERVVPLQLFYMDKVIFNIVCGVYAFPFLFDFINIKMETRKNERLI